MTDAAADLAKSIGGVRALASMVRRVRADRDLTETQLAARIERPPGYVTDLESARTADPTLLTIALVASACEVSVALFAASFAQPLGDKLPWPRDLSPDERAGTRPAGARAFGATLRDLRMERNWSQAALGDRAGLTAGMIGRLERGEIPRPTLLAVTQLGDALASSTPARVAHTCRLAQSYAGEIDAPSLGRMQRDRREPPAAPA